MLLTSTRRFNLFPEMELPFLDITLRISDARIQTSVYYTHNYLNLTSFYPHHCKNILSLTASFSGCAAFTLMVMTPFCDQADWFTLYWPWLFPFLSHKLSTKGSNHYPSRYAAPQLKVKKHVGLLHWSLFYRAAVSVYDAKAAIKSVSSLRYEAEVFLFYPCQFHLPIPESCLLNTLPPMAFSLH